VKYEESQPKLLHIFLLFLLFILIFSPWYLHIRELIGVEGKFGVMAIEMNLLSPAGTAHGEALSSCYPFYPWLVAIAHKLGLGIELSLRGISILALGFISLIVFIITKKMSGLQGAFVATCFTFSNIFILEKAIDGNPFTLTVVLLLSGWILWYYFGTVKGDWNVGWIVGLLFAGLAFYTIGWIALLYFFLPLIFMRRPLSFWNKLKYPGFSIGLCVVLFFILLWTIPKITGNINPQLNSTTFLNDISNTYFRDILLYPFNVIGGFMPWAIIAWPVFCVAYQPLDKNPIFSRFLRTIFFSLFFALWINPFTTTRDFIILVPPLAIMTGTNYWILIRRHGNGLQKIFQILTIIILILSILSLSIFFFPNNVWTDYFPFTYIHSLYLKAGTDFISKYFVNGVAQLSMGIILSVILISIYIFRKNTPIWLRATSLSLIFMLFFWSITFPYRGQSNDARNAAATLNKYIDMEGHNLTIYKGPHIADIYILSCYLNCKLSKIYNYEELPNNVKTIYIFTLNPPLYPKRIWKQITMVTYKDRSLYLWQGTLSNKRT
jgi:hypothetical protein